jgi:hypothetical protein
MAGPDGCRDVHHRVAHHDVEPDLAIRSQEAGEHRSPDHGVRRGPDDEAERAARDVAQLPIAATAARTSPSAVMTQLSE